MQVAEATIDRPSRVANPTVESFLAALSAGDFEALERLLAPDVWMRNLLVRSVAESHGARQAVEAFRSWIGGPHGSRMIDSDHHPMAGREFLRYRFLVRPEWSPERWHVIEQAGFCRVRDGRITRLDLACSGYYPVEAGPSDTR